MKPRHQYITLLIVLGIGWGATQPLGKIAASAGYPPLGMVFWQLVICSVVLGAISALRGQKLVFTRAAFQFYTIVALLGTLVPSLTFFISVPRLPAGIMSIIISTVPLIAFPIGLALGDERLSKMRVMGLMLGLLGVLLIALPSASLPDAAMAGYLPLAMIGPLFYALESTYVARKGTAGMDPVQAMFGASLMGAALCAPVMLALGQGFVPVQFGVPEMALTASSALHAMLYVTFVWLAMQAGAVFATQTSYVVTAAGVVWSMLLLGERFSPLVILAALVMMAGVALVQPRGQAE